MSDNREYRQIVEELAEVGDRIRAIVPREREYASGLTKLVYTSTQQARLAKLHARRDALRAAQRALLHHPQA